MKFGTKVIHAGIRPDSSTGAIMTPIYQTSTYAQESPGKHKGFEYARTQNPTRQVLENNIAALEGGEYGICFSSGMAATDAIIKLLSQGDEVIASDDLYGGTYRAFTKIFQRFGIQFQFVDMTDIQNVVSAITEKTKLIWIETPTNPMLKIVDIEALALLGKKHHILTCVDNTFATPFLQQPLSYGIDLSVHSGTKYLAGHSDVVIGAIATSNKDLADQLYFIQNGTGAIPGPQDCFLTLRGIKTLHLRIERSCHNAAAIAHCLKNHPLVEKVYWPGFKHHPSFSIVEKQMKMPGAMISFSLKAGTIEAANKVLSNTKVFTLAESLGGVESLIGHPATMTHASIPYEERMKTGVVDSLIRMSVGIEDVDDLIHDIENALSA